MKKCLYLLFFFTLIFLYSCTTSIPYPPEEAVSNRDVTDGSIESNISMITESNVEQDISEEQSEIENDLPDQSPYEPSTHREITELDGKVIATIYSSAFIQQCKEQRDNGLLPLLSADEANEIIADTIYLFENCDVIQIYTLTGTKNTYRGLPFYQSEEYFSCFGILYDVPSDISFDYRKDLWNAILQRIEVLHAEFYDGFDSGSNFIFTSAQPLKTEDWKTLKTPLTNIYELGGSSQKHRDILKQYSFGAFYFDKNEQSIKYIPDLAVGDDSLSIYLLSAETLPKQIGRNKYDSDGNVVIIELYETETLSVIARLRFDEKENADQMKAFETGFQTLAKSFCGGGNQEQRTHYRAIIYLNGFTLYSDRDVAITFCPDGDIDLFNFYDDHAITVPLFNMQKGSSLTALAAELLTPYILEWEEKQ